MLKTANLIVKDMNFEGYSLKSAQDTQTQEIYVAVRWVCNGIGLSRGQMNNESVRVKEDVVLSKGARNLVLPTDGGNQEVLCIDIDYLPLWLAKIHITPKMKQDKPLIVEKLIDYQLKAKDVLAKAFLYDKSANSQLFTKLLDTLERNNILLEENNQLRPKAEQFDTFLNSKGFISLNKTAKALKVGRNKMMKFLRSKSILFLDNRDNLPYQKYITAGYFTIDCNVGRDGKVHAVTRVSSRGVSFIHKLYQKQKSLSEGTVA